MSDTPEEKLTPKQELFCKIYTQNTELFGNATLAYAEAYGYDFDKLDTTRKKDKDGKDITGTSEFDKAYAVCAVDGSRMLKNAKINDFLRVCLNELLKDDIVDSELAKVIMQNHDLTVKVNGIKEYNKLKQRITEKIDHTTKGKELPAPIYGGKSTDI